MSELERHDYSVTVVAVGYHHKNPTQRVDLVQNKGNNKITELRTILQREIQNA
jgi:hypothetical protein